MPLLPVTPEIRYQVLHMWRLGCSVRHIMLHLRLTEAEVEDILKETT